MQLADSVSTKELMVRLGLVSTIVGVVRQGSLRWMGHVVRKRDDDCVVQRRDLGLKEVEERESKS